MTESAQLDYRVRFESGPLGAAAISAGTDFVVVVDVLSFATTLCVAAERGMTVLPHRWDDHDVHAYADQHDAVVALRRPEARQVAASQPRPPVSISPAHMSSALPSPRVVLPSPNGATMSLDLARSGARVVVACLRNRHAVARWLQPRLGSNGSVAVIAAGERWPDGSLRPAIEDVWGAGAVIAALADLGVPRPSTEATAAAAAFHAAESKMLESLTGCVSGRELIVQGFGEDLRVAARTDASTIVPVLSGVEFTYE